jgi:dienelactone hydrolase
MTRIAAAGYCFGGAAVLQYAKLGGAAASNVSGVMSFHGGLDSLTGGVVNFNGTKILIANGARDTQISEKKHCRLSDDDDNSQGQLGVHQL